MKIILIELNLQCSTVTHQSALTPILDFFLLPEVATMQQTDSAAHKLKPRLFYKSTHLQVLLADFYLWYELHLTLYKFRNMLPSQSDQRSIIYLLILYTSTIFYNKKIKIKAIDIWFLLSVVATTRHKVQ